MMLYTKDALTKTITQWVNSNDSPLTLIKRVITTTLKSPEGKRLAERVKNFAIGTTVASVGSFNVFIMSRSLYHSPEVADYLALLLTNIVNWLSNVDFVSVKEGIIQLLKSTSYWFLSDPSSPVALTNLIGQIVVILMLCALMYYTVSSFYNYHDEPKPESVLSSYLKQYSINGAEPVEITLSEISPDSIQSFINDLNNDNEGMDVLNKIETIHLNFNYYSSKQDLVKLLQALEAKKLAKAKFKIHILSDAAVIEDFTQFLKNNKKSLSPIHSIEISNFTRAESVEVQTPLDTLLRTLHSSTNELSSLKSLSFRNLNFPLKLDQECIPKTITDLHFNNSYYKDNAHKSAIQLTNVNIDRISFSNISEGNTIHLIGCKIKELSFGSIEGSCIALEDVVIEDALSFGNITGNNQFKLARINHINLNKFSCGTHEDETFRAFELGIRKSQIPHLIETFEASNKLDEMVSILDELVKIAKESADAELTCSVVKGLKHLHEDSILHDKAHIGDAIIKKFSAGVIDLLQFTATEKLYETKSDVVKELFDIFNHLFNHYAYSLIMNHDVNESKFLKFLINCNNHHIKIDINSLFKIIYFSKLLGKNSNECREIEIDFCILIIENKEGCSHYQDNTIITRSKKIINRIEVDHQDTPQTLRDKVIAIKKHPNFTKVVEDIK